MKKLLIFSGLIALAACGAYRGLPKPVSETSWRSKTLPVTYEHAGGDAAAGLHYLIYGDYIGSGLPYDLMKKRMLKSPDIILKREGLNANAPFMVNVFEAANGTTVVNGNCFTCHASNFEGEKVIGMGNSFSDYRKSLLTAARVMHAGMGLKYSKKSKAWQAYEDFGHYFREMAPHIVTNQPGANPAFLLAEACMNHRNPVDLTYQKKANFKMTEYPIASDVPPLWNVKKKNALYYNGIGRGDFSKLLFQASVLGIPDSAAARAAVVHFNDVVAWLHTLEAPKYKQPVNQNLVAEGEVLFNEHCSKCHGTYGAEETYPNKLVSLNVVKTDPLYAAYAMQSGIVEWYNSSWFAQSEPRSWFAPDTGYVAPPLDGIWITAPYLHNGSVPTLEDLLNSPQRPVYWSRSGKSNDYDYEKVGWRYDRPEKPKGDWTFDTTLPGYGNQGHYFGDKLSADERKAVIEYLKTL